MASHSRNLIRTITLLALLLAFAFASKAQDASASPERTITTHIKNVVGTCVSKDLLQSIESALARYPISQEIHAGSWFILDCKIENDWAFASAVLVDKEADEHILSNVVYVVAHKISSWSALTALDKQWRSYIDQTPLGLIDDGIRGLLTQNKRSAVIAIPAVSYLPWRYTAIGRVTQGYHGGYSIDLVSPIIAAVSDGTVVAIHSDSNIVCSYPRKYQMRWDASGQPPQWVEKVPLVACVWTDANYIAIQNSNGETSWYLHLAKDSIPVAFRTKGKYVVHGQVVGRQGNTGFTNGQIHLHFEISPNWAVNISKTTKFTLRNNDQNISSDELYPLHPTYGKNFMSYNVPIQGRIETPTHNSLTYGSVEISGWTKDAESSIKRVEIWIDNVNKGNATYGISRPDQGGAYGFKWIWNTKLASDGDHTIRAKAVRSDDGYQWLDINNQSGGISISVKTNNTLPKPPVTVTTNCGIWSAVWQNQCNNPIFTWEKYVNSLDVKGYNVYWGPLSNGAPNIFTTTPIFATSPVQEGKYYLRISSRDILDRNGPAATLFTLLYDKTPPTVSVDINHGAETTNQVNVNVNVIATNELSGAAQMRFSNGLTWEAWQPFTSESLFSIRPVNHANLPVSVQVKDLAGNIGEGLDTIKLSMEQIVPSSANFMLCAQTMNAAGSPSAQSQSFSLVSSFGEVGGLTSTNLSSGFASHLADCPLPLTQVGYKLLSSVFAASGLSHNSSSYSLNGTFGQALTSQNLQSSQSFQLQGGFWGVTP